MRNFFTSYKSPITFFICIILFAGVFVYSRMQTSLFPEITFPKIKIIADNGLQPVDKMMITVTKPLENAINRVPNVQTLRSTTSRGSCEISAFMDWSADINLSKQQIESSINEIRNALPPDVDITVEKMNPSVLAIMGYTLVAKDKSDIELNLIALNTIKPYLSQVDGVSEVRNIGGKTKEYQVQIDAQKMSLLGITPDMVSAAMSQTNFISSNGFASDYNRMYLTVTDAFITSKEGIENVIIKNDGQRIILLKDIASISINEAVEYTKINANGKKALLVNVYKHPDANLLIVSNNIEKKIAELNTGILPKGVELKPYYVQADFVHDSVNSVTDSLCIGIILALFVAIIFLRSFKTSIVLLITIPITIALTLIVMYVLGYTFNIMTLGALAASIGLLIDDAIVIVEQIHRTQEEYPNMDSKLVVSKSITYLFPAMIGSSLSTIVIFFPFVLMSGVAGAYFKVLTDTMIITLICSFFVTWIALPVIYILFSKKRKTTQLHKNIILDYKEKKWIAFIIKKPLLSFLLAGILIYAIIYIVPKLETGFLPEMDEGSIVMDYKSPAGTSLEETDRMLSEIEKDIVKIPEVESYSRRTGTQMGFFISEPNTGDYLIQLKKNRARTTDEVINDIRRNIEHTQPALEVDFGQIIGDMLGDLMASTQPIEIKIYGNDKKTLYALADSITHIVENTPGTADVFNGIVLSGPSITIAPDYIKLAQYGITPANFQSQLALQLQGIELGTLLENDQQTTIRLLYPDTKNTSLEKIKSSSIFLDSGQLIPIKNLAVVQVSAGEAEIEREDLKSMVAVTARLNNRDLGSTIKDIQKNISSSLFIPQGYTITYGGAYAEQQKSFSELLLILISSSLLIFFVIVILFRDFIAALLILFIALLGVSGSYIALYITHTPLNVGSYTGIIMIVGIIAENAIFTCMQFKQFLKTLPAQQAISQAVSLRIRPNLMTALGAIFALAPIALGIGTGAQLHQPLAIAVIGGFCIALPILFIIFPSMLYICYSKKKN